MPQPPSTSYRAGSQANEATTRQKLIDPALLKAGWDVRDPVRVGIEIPVDGFDPAAWQRLNSQLRQISERERIYAVTLPSGISDYVLKRANGEIIAVVEAKKTSIDPRLAQAQAEFYVNELAKRQSFRPFAFLSNGQETYFLDVRTLNRRAVAGFFSPEDLENLLWLRQNQLSLAQTAINPTIINRTYQHEAIRRVAEAFDLGKRKALLVMATGTGKTRTSMALVDLFLRSNQARRILFVADRDELVRQALNDGFKSYLPQEPCTRIFSDKIEKQNRLYVATLQTLNSCYEQFTPGFFDLIIFDEVHRSIFNKWNEVLHYFDARMVGLTATPAEFIDRNTFLAFECSDNLPTFLYTYKQAIEERYLVNYSLYRAKTQFQRKGIRGVDLNEQSRNALIDQGIDPDEIDFSGSELEKKVTNRDTLRKQWHEIMEACIKDEAGQLPGKTILFAMTQEHALRLEEVFNEIYPQFGGLARVITYKSDFKGKLIEQFKKESLPRIAITVDLLETGVDVPEVVNLVLMKPVQSRIKLDQMIGRGTRPQAACKHPAWLPNGSKREFVVLDFWQNDFDKQPVEELTQSLPVLVTLFNTRLKLLEQKLRQPSDAEFKQLLETLRQMIGLIPIETYSVRKQYLKVQQVWEESFWQYVTADKLRLLLLEVGPLLRYAVCEDVAAVTFTGKVERLKLQLATGENGLPTAQAIAEDLSYLPATALEEPACQAVWARCLPPERLLTASPAELNQVITELAPLMRNRRKQKSLLQLDLTDFIEERGYILLMGGSEPVYIPEYRRRVEERVVELIGSQPAIEALANGQTLSDEALLGLERSLRQSLGQSDVELCEEHIHKAWPIKVASLLEFLRYLLDLRGVPDYSEIVRRRFEEYIASQSFGADQILFLRSLQSVFQQKRRLRLPDLYEPPLDQFGLDAVERLFAPEQRTAILQFAESLTVVGE